MCGTERTISNVHVDCLFNSTQLPLPTLVYSVPVSICSTSYLLLHNIQVQPTINPECVQITSHVMI